jgi:hypothetical protein
MRKMLLALMLVMGLAAAAQAFDFGSDSPRPARFAALQNVLAPPAGATYSLGGYAPAEPMMDPNANSGPIDKGEYASPPGCCGGLWDGYMARPCHHRHHWGGRSGCYGGCGGCGPTPCNSGACGGGCGYGGGCGLGGYGCGAPSYIAPSCGCAPPCAPVCRERHHCKIFGCHKRSNCGCDVATTCDSVGCGTGCGCGATDSTQPAPYNNGAPQPSPELLEPAPAAPAPAPAPSAQRQPRLMRSMAGVFGS